MFSGTECTCGNARWTSKEEERANFELIVEKSFNRINKFSKYYSFLQSLNSLPKIRTVCPTNRNLVSKESAFD